MFYTNIFNTPKAKRHEILQYVKNSWNMRQIQEAGSSSIAAPWTKLLVQHTSICWSPDSLGHDAAHLVLVPRRKPLVAAGTGLLPGCTVDRALAGTVPVDTALVDTALVDTALVDTALVDMVLVDIAGNMHQDLEEHYSCQLVDFDCRALAGDSGRNIQAAH